MNDETNSTLAPKGLYRDPKSGATIGALDSNQASAYIHIGFEKVDDDPFKPASKKEVEAEGKDTFSNPDEGADQLVVEQTKALTPKDQTSKGTK